MNTNTIPRRRGRKILVALAACALAIVALEFGIRTTDFWGVSYHKDVSRYFNEAIQLPPEAANAEGFLFNNTPDRQLEFRTFRWRTDAFGFRREWEREPRADADRRILFLGDSVTLAWGVDAKDSWVQRVEEALNADGAESVRCFNAGHLRYDTSQAAGLLEAHGAALAPHVVVLTFVTNDLEDSWQIYQEIFGALTTPEVPGFAERAKGHVLSTFRGTRSLFQVVEQKLVAARQEPVANFSSAPGYAQNWERCERALERIGSSVQAMGSQLVILDHTVPSVPDLALWCEANAVAYADLRFTDEEWARGINNSPADMHANEAGNALLEAKALPVLRSALR